MRVLNLDGSLGLHVPRTVLLDNSAHAVRLAAQIRYPVVLKPRSSEEQTGGRTRATGAPRYAGTRAEFLDAYQHLSQRCRAVLAGGGPLYARAREQLLRHEHHAAQSMRDT